MHIYYNILYYNALRNDIVCLTITRARTITNRIFIFFYGQRRSLVNHINKTIDPCGHLVVGAR